MHAGLLHRDIKLDNILVVIDRRSGVTLQLSDFGTLQTMEAQRSGCTPGNPMKAAPELQDTTSTLHDLTSSCTTSELRTLHDIGRPLVKVLLPWSSHKKERWVVHADTGDRVRVKPSSILVDPDQPAAVPSGELFGQCAALPQEPDSFFMDDASTWVAGFTESWVWGSHAPLLLLSAATYCCWRQARAGLEGG